MTARRDRSAELLDLPVRLDHRWRLGHAEERHLVELLCATCPPFTVISCIRWLMPSITPPCTRFSACIGLMIWPRCRRQPTPC